MGGANALRPKLGARRALKGDGSGRVWKDECGKRKDEGWSVGYSEWEGPAQGDGPEVSAVGNGLCLPGVDGVGLRGWGWDSGQFEPGFSATQGSSFGGHFNTRQG